MTRFEWVIDLYLELKEMHVLLCRLDGIYAFQLLQEHESESCRWKHTPPSWDPAFEKDRDSFLSQGICDHLTGNLVISLPRIIVLKDLRSWQMPERGTS
jgi:hypothetical protein